MQATMSVLKLALVFTVALIATREDVLSEFFPRWFYLRGTRECLIEDTLNLSQNLRRSEDIYNNVIDNTEEMP